MAIAAKFPWQRYETFADIGTAQGALAVQVAHAHSRLTGLGFDLPAVRQHFDAFIEQHGFSKRISFQAGDFLADPLPKADVLVMWARAPRLVREVIGGNHTKVGGKSNIIRQYRCIPR